MPELTRFDVEIWIATVATGKFHYKSVCGLQGRLDPKSDNKLRGIIWELCKKGVCESVGGKDGWYRPVEEIPMPVDFADTVEHKCFPVILPFDLSRYAFIYPNTAIIFAGSKSSCKTGAIYRTVAINMGKVDIILLSNMEGGREQMYDRFRAMGIDLAQVSKFVYHVSENFHDYIKQPNTLFLIDYIDAPEGTDFYLIGAAISKIRKKLDNSVAIIGLQKPSFRDTAFGGEQTLKDAALYIALDNIAAGKGKLKIVDAKVPADKTIHPKNMQFTFKYEEEGTKFSDIKPYYGGD